jgi:hypothetical protein
MIKKIISGGQTGADQAALDAAIKWKIPHGGWVPKGRITEAGRLPNRYKVTEMPTDSLPKRTEQNVIDSDGTLIISHGPLTGGSRYTQEKAEDHNKPCLHIDLNNINPFQAAIVVKKWISDNNIETLNAAGARESKDKYIYQAALLLINTVLHMEIIENSMTEPVKPAPALPKTIREVIERLNEELSLRDKVRLANTGETDLIIAHPTLGSYIWNSFLKGGNQPLMQDCIDKSGRNNIDEDEASMIIVYELWRQLRKTHRLKAVK